MNGWAGGTAAPYIKYASITVSSAQFSSPIIFSPVLSYNKI